MALHVHTQMPTVFHGSQWVSLHRSLVQHIMLHPTAMAITRAFEQTLLPDEAMLQTIAVNSPHRKKLIAAHMRFIEWPQSHGSANKYWQSLGPGYHGGPMVLNETLAVHKAFMTSAMFARKFDPQIYADVLPKWDAWMAEKLRTPSAGANVGDKRWLAPRQPPIGQSLTKNDPELRANIPAATVHENEDWLDANGELIAATPSSASHGATASAGSIAVGSAAGSAAGSPAHSDAQNAAPKLAVHGSVAPASRPLAAHDEAHTHDHTHAHEHDEDDDHGHHHERAPDTVIGFVVVWIVGVLMGAVFCACRVVAREHGGLRSWLGVLRARLLGAGRGAKLDPKAI